MDKLRSIYYDVPNWEPSFNRPKPDDFLVAIGKLQSNSVYHIAEVRPSPRKETRMTRYYLKVLKSDLHTALKRAPEQNIIPIYWYPRTKKQNL